MLAVASLAALFASKPAYARDQQVVDLSQQSLHQAGKAAPPVTATAGLPPEMSHMMTAMKANGQKLDELVNKMNAAQGQAKMDAMAELLTALVQDRRTMCESMMPNAPATGAMHGRGDSGSADK
jgi:hypothetical protein